MKQEPFFRSRNTFVVVLGLVVYFTGLALLSYLGYYNRYWADDWCYNADFKRLGFLGTMGGYTYITTYASNRFSLTLFSMLLGFAGVPGVQIMTGLLIVFWIWGMYTVLGHVITLMALHFPRTITLLLTGVTVYYSIHLAPHPYQSIYWRSGLLPYTAPLVFGLWVFAQVLRPAVREVKVLPLAVFAGILAFVGGGFSEAGNATLTAMLLAYVAACLVSRRRKWSKNTLPIAVSALLASVLSMAVLILSPTAAYRLGLYEVPANLQEFPRLLLYYTYEFLAVDILNMPYTHLAVFGVFLLAGALSATRLVKYSWSVIPLITILLVAVLMFILISASFAPSVYIEKSLPALRTRIIARFVFILGGGLIAFIVGFSLKQRIRWRHVDWVLIIALLLVYAHAVHSIVSDAGKIPLYADRAEVWDDRDRLIRQSKDEGILVIHVRGIDGLPVGGIRDFVDKRGQGYWVNNCAVRYYGVEAIYASLP